MQKMNKDRLIAVPLRMTMRVAAQVKACEDRIMKGMKMNIKLGDVFINLVEVKKENWSFGNGIAQYVT